MTRTCKNERCGAGFELPQDDPLLGRFVLFCPECSRKEREAALAAEQDRIKRERESKWNAICPPGYRDTEIEKLPDPARAAEVLAWNYGPTGLLLHGATRRGKSRCAWLLARKVFDLGKSVRVLDAMAGFEYATAFASGAGAHAWISNYCRCGLLFFDDVFKARLTDSFEAAVFAIAEYRQSHKLPILASLNDTGETLTARMSTDRGDALVARLREMCQVIQF
jgi:DNA replication protein DnaC